MLLVPLSYWWDRMREGVLRWKLEDELEWLYSWTERVTTLWTSVKWLASVKWRLQREKAICGERIYEYKARRSWEALSEQWETVRQGRGLVGGGGKERKRQQTSRGNTSTQRTGTCNFMCELQLLPNGDGDHRATVRSGASSRGSLARGLHNHPAWQLAGPRGGMYCARSHCNCKPSRLFRIVLQYVNCCTRLRAHCTLYWEMYWLLKILLWKNDIKFVGVPLA